MLFLNNLYRKDVLAFGVKDNSCKRANRETHVKTGISFKQRAFFSHLLYLIQLTKSKHHLQCRTEINCVHSTFHSAARGLRLAVCNNFLFPSPPPLDIQIGRLLLI